MQAESSSVLDTPDRAAGEPLHGAALDQLFRDARTHHAWLDIAVADATLRELYALTKWGPTSMNASPARILFVRSGQARERLLRCLSPGNIEKTRQAPVTAIIAHDLDFHARLPALFPHNPDAGRVFTANQELADQTAFRNGTLQGAYLMMAARALGLDCGPMSGFDGAAIVREFFGGLDGELSNGRLEVNFLCNLGYGDITQCFPRLPRLAFEQACVLL